MKYFKQAYVLQHAFETFSDKYFFSSKLQYLNFDVVQQ